jgi:pPIWI_RE module N-terminal domain/RNaseH domain of pPIWI_RE/MID domain of pPIWI_RE
MTPRLPKYSWLQPSVFHIRTGTDWRQTFYLLRFPERWKPPLLALVPPRRNGEEQRSIPIVLLNDALEAVVPDIITTATHATVGERAPWLYSTTEIDTRSLSAIIAAWIRTQDRQPELVENVLHTMNPTDLAWERIEVNFTKLVTQASSPGNLTGEQLFQLLPHVLATEISAPGLVHRHIMRNDHDSRVQETSQFRRCPASRGAEVMSWPPHDHPRRPFSLFLNFSVQTRAFSAEPVIHLAIGTRRWCHRPAPTLSYSSDHTVYLLPSVPWLPGLVNSRSFLAAKIEPKATTDGGNTTWSAAWTSKLGQILADLGCLERLPDPEQLHANPAQWLGREVDAAALVFRNGMYGFTPPVSPGVSLGDRIPLLEWTAEVLQSRLQLADPLPRSARRVLPGITKSSSKQGKDDSGHRPSALRAAIAAVVGGILGVDIFYDTSSTLDYARRTFAGMLEMDVPTATAANGTPTPLATPELTILLTIRQVGAWGADLAPDGSVIKRDDRLRVAVEARIAEVKAAVGAVDYPAIALVEILGKDSYRGRRRPLDPKFAIKAGLGRLGRLTQCVTAASAPPPPSDDDQPSRSDTSEEKLKKCWHDLIRQLGVRAASLPAPDEGSGITQAPAYLAFWLIRQNKGRHWGTTRQIPVAVLISPDGTEIKACAPDVSWKPLHEAQRAISAKHMLSNQKRKPAEITRFFERILREVGNLHPSTLLLTDAQNLRSGWTYLKNPNLLEDHLAFGSTPWPVKKYPGLRHVRVRTAEYRETPQCYAFNDTEESSTYDGLWQLDGDRIFLSTGDKPPTAIRANRYASKITTFLSRGGILRNPSPRAMVWNARALELTVAALQAGDDPEDWATLAHELRWAASHYGYATTRPWPLEVARHIGEYVLPVELIEEIAEQDDSMEADVEEA